MKPYIKYAATGDMLTMQKLVLGGGIDTSKTAFSIDASSASYLRNISARNYPALSSREGRLTVLGGRELSSCRGIGTRELDKIMYVENDTLAYCLDGGSPYTIGVLPSTGTARCRFVQYNAGDIVYTIVTDGVSRIAWDGTTVVNLSGEAKTASTLVTAFNGRLFWAVGKTLNASALNDVDDYSTLAGVDTDSWSGTLSQIPENIVAISSYNNHVQLFTQSSLYELYGTKPTTYEVIPIYAGIGCISQWALTQAGGYLYFMDTTGIYRYNGSQYTKISSAVDAYIANINTSYKSNISLIADDKYLYVSLPDSTSTGANNLILKYDFEKGLWFVDTGAFAYFASFPKVALGFNATTGNIYNMKSGTSDITVSGINLIITPVSWDWISKVITDEQLKAPLTVSEIWVAINLPTGSSCTLSYSTDPAATSGFTTLYTFTASASIQNVSVPVALIQSVNWFKLRFTGTGPMDLYYMDVHMKGQKA